MVVLRWFFSLVLFASFARAGEDKPLFNSNGATVYSLIRVHEPFAGEARSGGRIAREISEFQQKLSANPLENTPEVQEVVRDIKDFLLDPVTRGLYQVFLDGIRNSSIKAISRTSGEKIVLQGPDAGLIHLKLFQGYQKVYRAISDFNPAAPEDHFAYFDEYLIDLGVTGFAAYVKRREFTMQMSVKKGTAADLWRSWNLAKSTRRVALGCGAMILAFGLGQVWNHPVPSERIQQEMRPPSEHKASDPQAEADAAAIELGESFGVPAKDGR